MVGAGMTTDAAAFDAQNHVDDSRAAIQRARHRMLDVLDALRSITAEANSNEIDTPETSGAETQAAQTTGVAHRAGEQRGGEPLVRASVNGEGTLVDLHISAAAMRKPMAEVGRLIVAVSALAAARAAYAHAETMRKSGFAHEPNVARNG